MHETITYNLRNSNDIQTLHANTNLFYNSFFPSAIRAWNALLEDVKLAPSVASFKYRLNRDIKKPPRYFNAGTRIGQILQARMRMECSSLNSHLYRKNIVPDPSCQCGTVLKVHINFSFVVLSIQLDIYRYNAHDFLFGRDNMKDHENEALFVKVQDYIIKSGRFT